MNHNAIEIGKNIKKYRELSNMSQEDLAKKLGYKTRSSIALIEAGRRELPYKKMQTAASALNTTVPKILGLSDTDSFNSSILRERESVYITDPREEKLITDFKKLSSDKKDIILQLVQSMI